ncbi:MAG: hypothetical protein WC071_11110, partial [Victivallaceae bacterium]
MIIYRLKPVINIIMIVFLFSFSVSVLAEQWLVEKGSGREKLSADRYGMVETELNLPGPALVYLEKDRKTLRAQPDDFSKSYLTLEARVENSSDNTTVKGHLFIKDKDGFWFQSRKEFELIPGEWQTLSVNITAAANELRPSGHSGTWDSQYAVAIYSAGISLFSDTPQSFTLQCRNLKLDGERPVLPLKIFNWKMPDKGELNTTMESTFELSREYFNPFNPDEIQIDVEAVTPLGHTIRWPAFYTRNFTRSRHFTREIIMPDGKAYWAFRFTPTEPGEYQLRLIIQDKSGKNVEMLISPDQKFPVKLSARKGFVKTSIRDYRFFEFSSGEFFFPVGINIHTNIDLRSEESFQFGHLPDRGTYDYDEYFSAMAANGINAVEIWMASWTFAIEWDCAREFYQGLGRYNLANAWKLDYVLNNAREKDIYVHLVLDNHGKLAANMDQEWGDNPFNAENEFAVANGGFLKNAVDFFTDPQARKLNRQRNRYIAARWGSQTNIFGIEFWSEVDLVSDFKDIYANGVCLDWHKEAVTDFYNADQGKHLLTTHVCGDYQRQLEFRKLFELPEHVYVIGDAYRKQYIHFVDQMRLHAEELPVFGKPVLITEFGGTSQAGKPEMVVGDIHCGLWSAFFKEQAGTPFLWWHDFVHLNNHYAHYLGFSRFINGIDLRNQFIFKELNVLQRSPEKTVQTFQDFPLDSLARPLAFPFIDWLGIISGGTPGQTEQSFFFSGLSCGNTQNVYGWIYFRQNVFDYPADENSLPLIKDFYAILDYPLQPGEYVLTFYNPLTA